jgi:hypothetical protein
MSRRLQCLQNCILISEAYRFFPYIPLTTLESARLGNYEIIQR